MESRDSPVLIVGAGPAGSTLAAALARSGRAVTLLHDPARRKHCGGGVPPRAFARLRPLDGLRAPRSEIGRLSVSSRTGARCEIELSSPLAIYDRAAFDGALRAAAAGAGARLVPARVTGIRREGGMWVLAAGGREHRGRFLVGADGAAGIVRRSLSAPFPPGALSLCAGYYLRAPDPGAAHVGFPGPPGCYTWIFPGPETASAGIVAPLPGWRGDSLRRLLRAWMAERFPGASFDFGRPFAAMVPTARLRPRGVCGGGWALIGDAAGVADPVTREGIFFSMRSAELLAAALGAGRPALYPLLLRAHLLRWHAASLFVRRWLFTGPRADAQTRLLTRSAAARRAAADFVSGHLAFGRYASAILAARIGRRGAVWHNQRHA